MEALLPGPRRFDELLEGLDGLAPNILSARLKALEAEGILAVRPYSQRPYRVAVRAHGARRRAGRRAAPARALGRPAVLVASPGGRPLHHATCGTAVEARWWCPTCGRVVADDEAPDLDYV